MSRRWHKLEMWCEIVDEPVTITLRRGGGFLGQPEEAYVHCDQRDCQYVDVNKPPCPLTIDMFKGDIDERVRTFLLSRPGSAFCHTCVANQVDESFDDVRRAIWRLRVSRRFPIGATRCAECHQRRVTVRASA
jgi:hypothetical protein